ncbi:MAG: hypothetical protein ACREOD_05920 [Candidatus Dormibacteria bacterium]
MSPGARRQLTCPSGCQSGRFELLGALVLVDRRGDCLGHRDGRASFRCAECQSLAVDLAAAARAAAREQGGTPAPRLRCPECGARLLAPEERDPLGALECPACGARFSWEEGQPSLLGEFSEPEEDEEQDSQGDGPGPTPIGI